MLLSNIVVRMPKYWREITILCASQRIMEDDLVAAYSGLGTANGGQYYRGEECLGW